jgi:hypothetical protein
MAGSHELLRRAPDVVREERSRIVSELPPPVVGANRSVRAKFTGAFRFLTRDQVVDLCSVGGKTTHGGLNRLKLRSVRALARRSSLSPDRRVRPGGRSADLPLERKHGSAQRDELDTKAA